MHYSINTRTARRTAYRQLVGMALPYEETE